MNDKVIVIAGFGVIDDRARADSFGQLLQETKEEFEDYDVQCVFTSLFVIRELRIRNIYIERLEEALDRLRAQSYREVVIQPTHLFSGEEYEKKIVDAARAFLRDFPKIAIGEPLLTYDNENSFDDAISCMRSLHSNAEGSEEIVFIGHGSSRSDNHIYQRLQEKLDRVCANITIGLLESNDCFRFDDVLSRLRKKRVRKVRLVPLLFVAGMHARIDLAGTHASSWKSRLLSAGFRVQVSHSGIGEYKLFRDIYIRRIKAML